MTGAFRVDGEGDREVTISREFAAPRELLFEAHVRPELVKRWLAAAGWTFPICEIDAREGGAYRYVWKRETGSERMELAGSFVEIVPAERISMTERFDPPWYPGSATVTTTFTETKGGTMLRMTVRYESREARDGVLASPMAKGVEAGYVKLERLLEDLQGDFR